MSSKGNRRAKGDKGPAKSSLSGDFVASLASGTVNMELLNGITFDTTSSSSNMDSSSQCVTYFGSNAAYRTQLKLLSKKSTVTRLRVMTHVRIHVRHSKIWRRFSLIVL